MCFLAEKSLANVTPLDHYIRDMGDLCEIHINIRSDPVESFKHQEYHRSLTVYWSLPHLYPSIGIRALYGAF